MPEIAKSLEFHANSRGGPKGPKTLHVEADGTIVNVTVGLEDREGRAVTRVDVAPEDETRGGDVEGRTWSAHPGDARIIRQHDPDERTDAKRPFRTNEQTRELMARHLASAAGKDWNLLADNGSREAWLRSADVALDIAYGMPESEIEQKHLARVQQKEISRGA